MWSIVPSRKLSALRTGLLFGTGIVDIAEGF
jgi:hypothetical protein